jgi:hypothetical protein
MARIKSAEEIVTAVKEYTKRLRDNVEPLPERSGKINVSAVAEACGFDRGRFYSNKEANDILDDYALEFGLRGIEVRDSQEDSEKLFLEQRVNELEKRIAAQFAEIEELRYQLAQYRHIENILVEGKRVY